jgi:pimeloyl-ACP methyl ester carboxylesterase
MNKTALIIHGWPSPIDPNGPYYKHFREWKYDVISPEIFSTDFILTLENVKKFILKELDGRSPDIIIGTSMGGLIAPHIAKDYPEAKMILIASAPKLKPKDRGFKLLIDIAKNKNLLSALNIVKILPRRFLYKFYGLFNPFNGVENKKQAYMDDMKYNFKYILSIPISKEGEIVNLITSLDNTELLKTLKNKTLVFLGENDLLMPQDQGGSLCELLSNSRLITSHGSHWDVISEPSFVEMKKFLQNQ